MRLMRTVWLVVILMLGVAALPATSVASASEYPSWVVNEEGLKVGETLAFTATTTTTLSIEAPAFGITPSAATGNCTITGSLRGTSC
jgi:hypothetical protein